MKIPFPTYKDASVYYKDILLKHYKCLRVDTGHKNAAFFYGFCEEDIAEFKEAVPEALAFLGRPFVVLDCEGKTGRAIYIEGARLLGADLPDSASTYDAWKVFEETMLGSSKTLVIQMLSKAKATRKSGTARSLIKLIDDAHFRRGRPESDFVFIDKASFLEKSWEDVGPYLRIIAPFNLSSMWQDELVGDATMIQPV